MSPVDEEIGRRIRLRRMMRAMSQERLGAAVGVTFQQIQKYERGTNRVSAARLQQIADVLGCPLTEFLESASGSVPAADAEALELMRLWPRMSAELRRSMLDLARSTVTMDGSGGLPGQRDGTGHADHSRMSPPGRR